MAFVKIRGQQIQDATLSNLHIAPNAAIAESKLDINWAARAQDVLSSKKVVDYVQVNGSVVGGLSSFDLSALIPANQAKTTSDPLDVEGIVVSGIKNVAPVRDVVTGEPILSASGAEVYGRVEFVVSPDGGVTPDKFVLNFYSMEGTVETAFVMPEGQSIDWQYAQRFNLQTVNEMFAANEKFVQGAADVTAHLNLEQLAKDIYGPLFSLDRDGNANLTRSLVDEIKLQTSGLVNTEVRASAIIDEVVAGRGTFASIGARFADVDNKIAAINTKDADQDARLDALESGAGASNQEIIDARTSDVTGAHLTLDARIEAGEAKFVSDIAAEATARQNADTAIQAEVDAVEADLAGYKTSNDTRVAAVEAKNTEQDGKLSQLQTDLTAEVNRATAAESALQSEVDAVEADLAGYKTAQASKDSEQDGKITALESEVQTARGTQLSLDARLDQIEADAAALASSGGAKDTEQDGRLDAVEAKNVEQDGKLTQLQSDLTSEVSARQAADTALQGEVDAVEADLAAYKTSNDSRSAAIEAKNVEQDNKLAALEADAIKIHKFTYQAVGGETQVSLPTGQFFIAGNESLDVFINGTLQSVGLHYAEIVDGADASKGLGVDFAPEVLVAGDVITFKFHKKASQI